MSRLALLEFAEIGAYALASSLYLAYHAGWRVRLGQLGRWALALGVALQLVDIGAHCLVGQHPLSSTPETVAFVGWLTASAFLVASARYQLAAAGASVAPAALILSVLARVTPESAGAPASLGPLAIVHIFLSALGVALFGFAAILALLYLVQERHLKRKEFDRIPELTAPLQALDRLAARCVSVGFPVFTVALVTGAVLLARMGLLRGGSGVRVEYIVAVVSWLAFAALLVVRAARGWQGRRTAWLTVGGFGGALLVLLAYFLRQVA